MRNVVKTLFRYLWQRSPGPRQAVSRAPKKWAFGLSGPQLGRAVKMHERGRSVAGDRPSLCVGRQFGMSTRSCLLLPMYVE